MEKMIKMIDDATAILDKLNSVIYLRYLLSEDMNSIPTRTEYILRDKSKADTFLLDCEREIYFELLGTLSPEKMN